jgi:hypothetical protein
MRDAVPTVTVRRSALSTRRDLLLEILALHHQLVVLGRSDRRFRPSDRLFWMCLRLWWPRWREALVLVQPATVARWQREGFRRCRSRRRPGRPRIDSELRTLIGRMATENWLWGAPRIHGELLKLGFTISERTVSRYLRDRPTRRSQTWRTFLANHVGILALASTVTPTFAMNTDDAQSSEPPYGPLSLDRRCASNECAFADSLPPIQSPFVRSCTTLAQLHASTPRRFSSGKDPPRSWVVQLRLACPAGDSRTPGIPSRLGSDPRSRRKLATLRTQSGLAHRWQTDTTFTSGFEAQAYR